MATLTNGGTAKQKTRKKLIQPVLPALPLYPKKTLPQSIRSATPDQSLTPPPPLPQLDSVKHIAEQVDQDETLENHQNKAEALVTELEGNDKQEANSITNSKSSLFWWCRY